MGKWMKVIFTRLKDPECADTLYELVYDGGMVVSYR